MIYTLDAEQKGHVMVYDGPLDLVSAAKMNNSGPKPFKKVYVNYPGRQAVNWDQLEQFLHTPWPQTFDMVQKVVEGIKRTPLPEIESVRRRPVWDENDGEVDVDKALRGDPDFYRASKRRKVVNTTNITIITNLDTAKNINPSGVFFRSAVAIALADILEEAGYSVELWVWCLGWHVYPKPNHKQFTAVRPKRFGDPMDVNALCDTLSGWFTEVAIFGAFMNCPAMPEGLGYAVEPDTYAKSIWDTPVSPWMKYMDLNRESKIITVPMVYGYSGDLDSGIRNGVKAAGKVLERVNNDDW